MSPRSDAPVVLVTGAAGQLGSAIARALAAKGASLVLSDLSAGGLDALSRSLDVPVVAQVGDVTGPDEGARLVAGSLDHFGRLDGVVNNAGIEGPAGVIEDIALADVRRVFEVNVFALVAVTQAALRHFKSAGGGRIVNIASGAGLAGNPLFSPYSASKHAVVGFTRSIASEAAAHGVIANAVCPGVVESPMIARIEARLSELKGAPVSFRDAVPMGRYADPAEVGELVAWLCLEAPAYINGSPLVIDGALRA